MPPPTQEQQTAINLRDTSIVLSSGAGCGKTTVLTQRYISYLKEDGASVGQIIAITFTEKAAREMRDRIRVEVAKLPDSKEHLRHLEKAQIATIHAFCGNLLRQFAIPLGLDSGFEVLDDVLSANPRTEAVTGCLHELLEADATLPAAGALRELVVLYGYPAVVEAVDSLVQDVDRPAWQAWLARPPEEIADEWTGTKRRELLPGWVAYLCAASPKITRCLALMERVQSGSAAVMEKARRLREELPRLHEAADLAARIVELTELAKVQGTKKPDWRDDDLYEAVKDAFTDFRGDLPKRFDLFTAGAEGTAEAARVGQLFLRVALAVDDEYRRRKQQVGALDFQDLLVLARDLLRDHAEVRATLQKRYRFILLDELQDTDPVQMELVSLLCGDELKSGKLFAVGDHKQSIYRFRGAEVGLFTGLEQSVGSNGRLGLTGNFRSQPGVLKFVNALFAKRIPEYVPLDAKLDSVGDFANVEFLWSLGEGAVNEMRAAEADGIARRIVALLADATPRLLGKNNAPPRRVELKDITLLFRAMTNVAIYEAALRRHGIDYYLVGGRAFFAQQEVYDLLNVLRSVENPHDSVCLIGALRSPFFNVSDEAVFLIATHEDGPWAGLRDLERRASIPNGDRPAADRATRWLASWRELKDRLPIARLLNRILADSGYDAALQFEFLGDRKLANLWKLIDLARTFDRTGLFGLHEFTARLGDLVVRQPREEQAATLPESADVVKLMSIHQAKGLEFPVVLVADFAALGRGDRHLVARWHRSLGCLARVPNEFDEFEEERPFAPFANELGRTADLLADWQEDLRVLYVACTRASDLLILSAGLKDRGDPLPSNHWTLALTERFDVEDGKCVASDVKPEDAPKVDVVVMKAPDSKSSKVESVPGVKRRVNSQWVVKPVPPQLPRTISLAALEARMRADANGDHGADFDIEVDADSSQWPTPQARAARESPTDAVLRAVLERWNFAEVDGWVRLLADALADSAEPSICDELRARLARFAGSRLRGTLAVAEELHRSLEFVADLSEECATQTPIQLRGIVDLLYRDASGWHILAFDRGGMLESDPWLGRKPGLILQAWATSKQLRAWPATLELFDLSNGRHLSMATQEHSLRATAERFLQAVNPRSA